MTDGELKSDAPRDSWLTSPRFAAFLLFLGVIVYPDLVFGWKTLFHHDYTVFGYPLAYYHRESFWRGEIPLWNPLSNCGLPFLAQWNTLTLYPGSLIYLLLPFTWGLGIFCLFHLMVGGLGMYALAFRWTGSRLAAAFAGVALAFNGLSQACLTWPNNVAALGLMPWVIFAVEKGWRQGGKYVPIAAIVGALQMLTGAPEFILFTWLVTGVLFLFQPRRSASSSNGETQPGDDASMLRQSVRCVVIVALVAGLASAQLLPFFDLLRSSQRDTNYAGTLYSMPPTGWANFIVPLFNSYKARYGVYFQAGQQWTTSYYAGIGLLACAAFAIFKMRERRVFALAGLTVLALLLALGDNGPIYPALRNVFPQIGFMNFPVKFVVLAVFCLPLLAAVGVAKLEKDSRGDWQWFGGVIVALCVTAGGLIWFESVAPSPRVEWRVTMLSGATRCVLLVAIAGALYWSVKASLPRHKVFAQVAVVALMALDVFTLAPDQNPRLPNGALAPHLERTMDPMPRHGQGRVWIDNETYREIGQSRLSDPVGHILLVRHMLHMNCNLLDEIPKTDGFFSLYLGRAAGLKWLADSNGPEKAPGLFNFLSISHVPDRERALEWKKREQWLPMVTAGQTPVFANPQETWDGLKSAEFDPLKQVYLRVEAQDLISARAAARVTISETRFGANELNFRAQADAPGLVTISQSYHRWWRAYVDGKPVRLVPANYAFQALEIPAGEHQVKLVYEDKYFAAGTMISLVSLMACVGAWWFLRRRETR